MRRVARFTVLASLLAFAGSTGVAQSPDLSAAMHWREIGPTRAGRARALAGVPSQPNVFYIGFDNGGVWRSTDYGSTWTPLFDKEPTGSIGAIAVAPSDPNVIYVGTGAAIIRPDLAVGDGVYKSTDGGKTWTHLGLRGSQMIAYIDVDPRTPDRLFVAALGHPYGPNEERGIFRSTDGGKTFEKVLYKDEYTSANDVRIDPNDPNTVYATLWQQQQSFIEGGAFAGPAAAQTGGIFKSTDGGTTWTQLTDGLPAVSQANLGISRSNSKVLYAAIAPAGGGGGGGGGARGGGGGGGAAGGRAGGAGGAGGRGGRGGRGGAADTTAAAAGAGAAGAAGGRGAADTVGLGALAIARGGAAGGRGGGGGGGGGGAVGLYKSTDGGEHWHLAVNDQPGRSADNRPMARIGGGDLPTLAIDPKNPDVVYSCSTVFWRSEDGGVTWSAVRGAPGGDDYQQSWVNPNNTDIILLVSDQGGVVSANRGTSWSNWYTQPTAAVYHVTTDMSFPYAVCSGQQDSGSACVDSRSNDGEITFHDWHPVNIQEYGEAAPDPRDATRVFGSSRTGVSLYDRVTGQTGNVGPDASVIDGFNRNVRTMPIEWSKANSKLMFYANNAVFKTSDGGNSWKRISGDLARQTWEVPANAGKYANTVTPGPQGTITALAPSPRDTNVLWTGTDDGTIQVTMDGGAKWTNVTPPQIKPWTRIYNMDAGHFDNQTAYVAANTLRLDDLNPHFWRTHDGGKTWTEIDNGIAPGAASNSIREDPRQKGVLYGATDTQVWVSFDDGNHWESLREDMPAVSVRDLEVKDDSTCLCSDLVAGTHGRGFWILDAITPLRQAAEARAATQAYLFKPEPAVRVRWGTNDPTPWPPELPAGENPPPGAIVDYYLTADASSPVTLDVLNASGAVVRRYSSDVAPRNPDPAIDPVAYNKICEQTPNAADCSLPLYWPAPQLVLSAKAGMHRFEWDMHYDALGGGGGGRGGGGGGGGAVPHHTGGGPTGVVGPGPWAAPGNYTVRLTVGGHAYTQPITLHYDPRLKNTAALAQLTGLTTEMYFGAVAARDAGVRARALVTELDGMKGSDIDAYKAKVNTLLTGSAAGPAAGAGGGAPAAGGGGRGGRGGGGGRGGRGGAAAPAGPPTLDGVSSSMYTAANAMQSADRAPTAPQLAACDRAQSESRTIMSSWNALTTTDLAALNAKRKAAGQPVVVLPK